MEAYYLPYNFIHKDNLLDYFAEKSNLDSDCPLELQKLYNIGEGISKQELKGLEKYF